MRPLGWNLCSIKKDKAFPILWNTDDSSKSYGVFDVNPRGMTELSLGGWVYIGQRPEWAPFFGWQSTGSWGGITIGEANSKFYFRGGSRSKVFTDSDEVALNEWNHVFLTMSQSRFRAYKNGNCIHETVSNHSSVGSNVSTRFICIGGNPYNDVEGVSNFQKKMALFNILAYDKELSEDEIKSLYDNPYKIQTERLWFGFDFSNIEESLIVNIADEITGMSIINPSKNIETIQFVKPQ